MKRTWGGRGCGMQTPFGRQTGEDEIVVELINVSLQQPLLRLLAGLRV